MNTSTKLSPPSVGAQIREAREAANLSQSALAQRAGIAQHSVSDLEMGYEAKLSTLIKVAGALELAGQSALRVEANMNAPTEKPWTAARRARDQKKTTRDPA